MQTEILEILNISTVILDPKPVSHPLDGLRVWGQNSTFLLEFLDPQPPTVPPSPTPGAWPRWRNENPIWYVLYLSIVWRLTKFGLKIFEIDFVIEI